MPPSARAVRLDGDALMDLRLIGATLPLLFAGSRHRGRLVACGLVENIRERDNRNLNDLHGGM